MEDEIVFDELAFDEGFVRDYCRIRSSPSLFEVVMYGDHMELTARAMGLWLPSREEAYQRGMRDRLSAELLKSMEAS